MAWRPLAATFRLAGMRTDSTVKKAAFLRMLRNGSSVQAAARELGINRPHKWRRTDAAFAAAWDALKPPGRFGPRPRPNGSTA